MYDLDTLHYPCGNYKNYSIIYGGQGSQSKPSLLNRPVSYQCNTFVFKIL